MEYAAYKGIDSIIDFAGLTDKFAGEITDISNAREKEKEDLNQMAVDASRGLSEIEMTKTESLNDKILGLADQGREKITGWNDDLINGRISVTQFRRNMSSVNEYTSLVASTAKTFDAKMQEYIKRQADETGSAVELEKIERFGMMTDLQNIDFKVLDDGRIAVDVKDPKTGEVIRQEDLLRINKSENAQTPRMNLSKEVNTVVKNWAADGIVTMLGQGGYENSASAMNDPKYKLAKQRLVDQLVTQNAVSLLVDNGGITTVNYAYNDEDKNAKLKEIIAKEKDVRKRAGNEAELTAEEIADLETGIIIIDNNGDVQLTDDQIDKAREAADREIDLQVGNELKAVAPQNWYGNAAGAKAQKQKKVNAEGYILSLNVMSTPQGSDSNNNGYLGQLKNNALAKGENLHFVRYQDPNTKEWGIAAYPIETKTVTTKSQKSGAPSVSEQKQEINFNATPQVFMTAQQLSPYIYGITNAAEASEAWADGSRSEAGQDFKIKWDNKMSGKKTTPTTKPSPEMVTLVLPDGQVGTVPEDKVDDFLKKYPKAKRK